MYYQYLLFQKMLLPETKNEQRHIPSIFTIVLLCSYALLYYISTALFDYIKKNIKDGEFFNIIIFTLYCIFATKLINYLAKKNQ